MGVKSLKLVGNTGARLLERGLHLMSEQGLAGVTLGRLAQEAGISKSGVFAHFDSKEAVQLALLEHSAHFASAHVVEPAMREPAGLPRVRALVHHWFGWSKRAGLPGGCPIAAAMFELDDVDGPMRDTVARLEGEWRGLLSQCVAEAVHNGELRADLDVDQFVWELCGIYLSHHVAMRFVRDPKADQRGQVAFDALVTRALAGA